MKLHLPKAFRMSKISKVLFFSGLCFAIVFFFWILPVVPFLFPKRSERILETREFRRGENRVVVTAYAEENSFVPGAYYSFEAVDASDHRREIATFRHDDPVPINKDGIVFLNDDIGYLFMGWMYAVTTDGGATWHVWSADKNLPDWECCNYKLIQEVHIAPDGKGTMKLNPIPTRSGEVPELYTKDYGRHWSPV